MSHEHFNASVTRKCLITKYVEDNTEQTYEFMGVSEDEYAYFRHKKTNTGLRINIANIKLEKAERAVSTKLSGCKEKYPWDTWHRRGEIDKLIEPKEFMM